MSKNLETLHVEAHSITKGDLIEAGEDLLIAARVDVDGIIVTVVTEDGPRTYTLHQVVTVLR